MAAHAVVAAVTSADHEPAPDPRQALLAAGCLYTLLLGVALAWLWSRDRLELVRTEAIGRHGPWWAAAAGLATGLAGTAVFLAVRRSGLVRAVESQVRDVIAPLGDTPAFALVIAGAVAEEVFFRLAVQDAFGLPGAVAVCAVLGTCTIGWRLLPFTVLHATALGLLMQGGFGLLGTTTANAILNHLCLRRILAP